LLRLLQLWLHAVSADPGPAIWSDTIRVLQGRFGWLTEALQG